VVRFADQPDWMDILGAKDGRLDREEERIHEIGGALRGEARAAGRRMAQNVIKRIDPVFAPRRLNADDAKVFFHPVDYIVSSGLNKSETTREILFLDRETKAPKRRHLQRRIEKPVEAGKYDLLTIRIQDRGTINEE
jgi:predicted Holliday junction resolvase-like endonuclease